MKVMSSGLSSTKAVEDSVDLKNNLFILLN